VVFGCDNANVSALIWSGSAWGNEPSAAITTNLAGFAFSGDSPTFQVAYESSGDVIAVLSDDGAAGTSGLLKYKACTGGTSSCTWGATTAISSGTINGASYYISLAANPNTDELLLATMSWQTSANTMVLGAGYWSGSAWSTVTANIDTSVVAVVAGNKSIATGWLTSGATKRGIIAYNDSAATNIGWVVWDGSSFTVQSDASPTPAFANPQTWYDIQMDPVNKDRLMLTVSDSASDVFAKRLVMTSAPGFTWTDANGGAAIETSLALSTTHDYAFAYYSAAAVPENFWLLVGLSPLLWMMILQMKRQRGAGLPWGRKRTKLKL
jgi:hypothetical protein